MGNTNKREYVNALEDKYSEVNKSTTITKHVNDHQVYTQHDKDIGNRIGGNVESVGGLVDFTNNC